MSAYCSCNIPGRLGCSRSEVVGRRPPCMVEDGSRRSCRTDIEIPSSLLNVVLHDRHRGLGPTCATLAPVSSPPESGHVPARLHGAAPGLSARSPMNRSGATSVLDTLDVGIPRRRRSGGFGQSSLTAKQGAARHPWERPPLGLPLSDQAEDFLTGQPLDLFRTACNISTFVALLCTVKL